MHPLFRTENILVKGNWSSIQRSSKSLWYIVSSRLSEAKYQSRANRYFQLPLQKNARKLSRSILPLTNLLCFRTEPPTSLWQLDDCGCVALVTSPFKTCEPPSTCVWAEPETITISSARAATCLCPSFVWANCDWYFIYKELASRAHKEIALWCHLLATTTYPMFWPRYFCPV